MAVWRSLLRARRSGIPHASKLDQAAWEPSAASSGFATEPRQLVRMGWMFLCLAHKWWPPLKKFATVEAANATPTASPKFRDVMSQNFARAKLLETTLPSSQPRCRCGPSPGA